MRIRGIIRDILSIYVGFRLIKGYLFKNFQFDIYIFIAAFILFVFGIWFLIERILDL